MTVLFSNHPSILVISLAYVFVSCTSPTIKNNQKKIVEFTTMQQKGAALSPLLAFNQCLHQDLSKIKDPDLLIGDFSYKVLLNKSGEFAVGDFHSKNTLNHPKKNDCEKKVVVVSQQFYANYIEDLRKKYGMREEAQGELQVGLKVEAKNKVSGSIDGNTVYANLSVHVRQNHEIENIIISSIFTQAFIYGFFPEFLIPFSANREKTRFYFFHTL